jgi:hypothetical protein
MLLLPFRRDLPGRDQIPLLPHERRQMKPGQRGRLMVSGPCDKGLQCDPLPFVEVRAHGRVRSPEDPIEVGGQKRSLVCVAPVKGKQFAKQPGRLQERRIGVGDLRIGLRFPFQKGVARPERRPVSRHREGILGVDEAAFARGGEGERVADDHVPDRRPIGVGHRPLLDDRRPVGDREFRQLVLLADGDGEPAADLADDHRQIPGSDLRNRGWLGGVVRCAAGSAARKPPAIVLEKFPGPVGPDRLEHASRLRWSLLDRRRQPHDPLRIILGPVARLGDDPRGDRPGHLRPGLVDGCRLFDSPERLGGRLRLAVGECLFDPLPLLGPRPRHSSRLITESLMLRHDKKSPEDNGEQAEIPRKPDVHTSVFGREKP